MNLLVLTVWRELVGVVEGGALADSLATVTATRKASRVENSIVPPIRTKLCTE